MVPEAAKRSPFLKTGPADGAAELDLRPGGRLCTLDHEAAESDRTWGNTSFYPSLHISFSFYKYLTLKIII